MTLFDSERHEPLDASAWDEAAAREAIRAIVRDIEDQRSTGGHWPVHELDEAGDTPSGGFKGLYLGSAGVLWALWWLQRQQAVQLRLDPVAGLRQADADYSASPDSGQVVPSHFLGEAGIVLLLWCMAPSEALAQRLHGSVRSNIEHPSNEALWGAPGTMVAAWHLWQATADERWRALYLDNVEALWHGWQYEDAAQCHLWTQDLYGTVVQYLGAGHGFAGNAWALLKGAALLDEARREALYERCLHTLQATARRDDGGAVNWPAGTFRPRPGSSGMLMQWCHGAPGIVCAMADYPAERSPAMEALLRGAGEAIWRAGPLTKGAGLCHGTAGNGEAFLTLYRRSGETLWLDRARHFAMHAIGQWQRARQRYRASRCTLWTGDAGLAVYLWQCIEGHAGLPALDFVR